MSTAFAVIAQAVSDNGSMLIAYGPLGIICGWFMLRCEKLFTEIRGLAHRIDGLTRALLVDMINRESCGAQTKAYAQEAIAKIDARNAGGSTD